MPKKLCWNVIVKNEASRIARAAMSAIPHISCAVIHDTGSTDETKTILQEIFAAANIPFKITDGTFVNFAQARNEALSHAWASGFDYDYLLLFDADMELKVLDPTWTDTLDAPSYCMMQQAGTLFYQNARLLRSDVRKGYLCPTHEYLDVPPDHCIPQQKAYFYDHADGANRLDKFKRDIQILKQGLKEKPNDPRMMYYLAQSYRDAGKFEKAAKWYKRRVEAGGWDQEVWSAQYLYAACLQALGDTGGWLKESLEAYHMRPSRVEPLYDLARYFREKGHNYPSLLFSEMASQTPPSTDALFVNDHTQTVGTKMEFSISAYYCPWKQTQGRMVNNWLSLYKGPYADARDLARMNMIHYVEHISKMCPSFTWKPLSNFTPPDMYTAMNPSICLVPDPNRFDKQLAMVVRTVNYRMDEYGRYLIRANDGTANDSNPIHTRSFLVYLDNKLDIKGAAQEILVPADWPEKPAFPPVIGFEDMRLYHTQNELWVSACVRELRADGVCEQVRARIDLLSAYRHEDGRETVTLAPGWQRMQVRGYEKNWMPILNGKQEFMYRCDEQVDGDGKPIVKYDLPIDIGTLSGGTQCVHVQDGWLALVHEARHFPDRPIRYYIHRWVAFDHDFKLRSVSLPFYFNEKTIEYAAGLAIHPDGERFVISYGFQDKEARLATVSIADVTRQLWQS